MLLHCCFNFTDLTVKLGFISHFNHALVGRSHKGKKSKSIFQGHNQGLGICKIQTNFFWLFLRGFMEWKMHESYLPTQTHAVVKID